MASSSAPTDGIYVEIQASLDSFDRAVAKSDAEAKAFADRAASQFGRVEKSLGALGAAAQGMAQANNQAAAATAKAQVSMAGFSKSAEVSSYQIRNLLFQLNDVGTMLASGSSPFQVLATQGGQIAQILGETGVSGAAKGLRSAIASVLTPTVAATTAIVAFGAAGIYAYTEFEAGQKRLSDSLDGLGRGTAATVGQLNRIAEAAAAAGHVSIATARDMTATFSATGKIGTAIFGDLIKITRDYATATGQDATTAAQQLAQSFADPVKGAMTLNEKLGFLNDRMLENVRAAQREGDVTRAQTLLVNSLAPAIAGAADKTGFWTKQWETLGRTASNAIQGIGAEISRVMSPTLDQQMESLLAARARIAGQGWRGFQQQALGGVNDQIADVQENIRRREQLRAAQAASASASALSLKAGEITRRMTPDSEEVRQLREWAAALEKALGRPELLSNAEQTREALDRINQTIKAGGTAAFGAVQAAQDKLSTAGLSEYARGLAEINQRYRDLIWNAKGSADAIAAFNTARTLEVQAFQKSYLAQPSSYARGVVNVPEQYRQQFLDAGKYVDPNLLASMAFQESRFNPNARSRAGATGLMQFMPGTAAQYGIDPTDPNQSIDGAARMMRDLLDKYNGNTSNALAAYNWGQDNVDKWLKKGGNAAALPAETRDYIEKVTRLTPDLQSQVGVIREWDQSLADQTKTVQINIEALGKSSYEVEKARQAQQMEAELIRQNIPITEEWRKSIEARAAAYADLAQRAGVARAAQDIRFEREQLGRDPIEQGIASRLKGYGIDYDSASGQVAASGMRLNETLRQTKDLAGDALKGFVSDLRAGKSGAEALQGVLTKIEDKLLDIAMNDALAGLFGTKSGGGFLSKLLSGLGGGGGSFAADDAALNALPDSAFVWEHHTGGFAGFDGRRRLVHPAYFDDAPRYHSGLRPDEVPAILQRGEYVLSRADVAAINSVPSVPAMPSFAPPPSGPVIQMGDTHIDARGSTMTEAQFKKILDQRDRELTAKMPAVVAKAQQRSA